KRRARGIPKARLSNHKNRAIWFQARVTWPLREAAAGHRDAERGRSAGTTTPAALPNQWELAGPNNIGGRCTSIVCDPTDADHIWIGAAGGGVWTSTNGGGSWSPQWSTEGPQEIGALAIDVARPTTIYAATGEANQSVDSYPGDGIYRSTDAG